MTTPELLPCPVCRGVSFHPYGFYAAIEYPSGSSAINISPEKCRSCNNGIIGLPTPDTRLREAAKGISELIKQRANNWNGWIDGEEKLRILRAALAEKDAR